MAAVGSTFIKIPELDEMPGSKAVWNRQVSL